MVPQLPHELSDCIIDFLHDDCATLSACGLVCRAWLSVVRYHRFATTRVNGRLAPFLALLAFSPGICPFVRALELHGFPYPHARRYEPEELLALLDLLPGLSHLGLTSARLDGPLVSALIDNATFKEISSLRLRWCEAERADDVVRLLTTPALEHLEIDRPFCHLHDSESSIDLPLLKSLSIAGMHGTNDFPRRIIAGTHQIQMVRALVTWRAEAKLVAEILDTLGGSVKHIDIDVDAENNLQAVFDDTSFSLANLSTVRSCRLTFTLREMFVAGNMSLPWINKLVIQALSTQLQKISLHVRADGMEDLRALDSECGVRDVTAVNFDDYLAVLDWEGFQAAADTHALKAFVVEGRGDTTRFLDSVCTQYPGLGSLVHPRHVR